jgi:hypothetical protein
VVVSRAISMAWIALINIGAAAPWLFVHPREERWARADRLFSCLCRGGHPRRALFHRPVAW